MSRRRIRCLQLLEPRRLLAGDGYAVVEPLGEDVFAASEVGEDLPDLQAGNSWITARDLGVVTTAMVRDGRVSARDRIDYYEFQVAGPAELNATVFSLDADVALSLYDASGQLIRFSNQPATAAETIGETLSTGSYYLTVVASSDSATSYQLAIASTGRTNYVRVTDGNDLGGDSFGRATELGELGGNVTYWDRVGGNDPADVFRFRVTGTQNLALQLDRLTANVDLHVFTTDGRVVDRSRNSGLSDESLQLTLTSGEYFVLLFPANQNAGDYRFQINATPGRADSTPPANLDGGDTFRRASDLGTLQQTLRRSETIGGTDTTDVYRFTLAKAARVRTELRQLSVDLDLYVFDSQFRLVGRNYQAGATAEKLSLDLKAGVYYALIIPRGDVSGAYELLLDPQVAAPAPPPTPPPTPSNIPIPLPDVPDYGSGRDWYLNRINAPEAWAYGITGKGMVIAVIDSGVDRFHPDLVDAIWRNRGEVPGDGRDNDGNGFIDDVYGWDFVDGDADVADPRGHGTHVAGTIAAARNGVGATGVAYDAKIIPIRVLRQDGSGKTSRAAAGIRYAVDMGADIISLSLMSRGYSTSIYNALKYAQSKGVFVAAAAGNDSDVVPRYPARHSAELDNVISVGAYDQKGRIADFSNGVGNSRAVQIDAPGIGIYSTLPDNSYGYWFGTSMATPQVASIAALIWQANPGLTAAQVRVALTQLTDRQIIGTDSTGGLNASGSVGLAANTRANGLSPANVDSLPYMPVVEDVGTDMAGRPQPVTVWQDVSRRLQRARRRHRLAFVSDLAPLRRTSLSRFQRSSLEQQTTAVDHLFGDWTPHRTLPDSSVSLDGYPSSELG